MRPARGAALVLVLWLIALLTAVIGAFALSARVEHMQQRVIGDDAIGQEYARAGLEYALHRLQPRASQPAWVADGRRYRWTFDTRRIDLTILDENGKINLNLADVSLLSAFLRAMGKSPGAPSSWPAPSSTGAMPTASNNPVAARRRPITSLRAVRTAHAMRVSRPWANCSAC